MSLRVVFDSNIVVSALLFREGRPAWLRTHWGNGDCRPLASHSTVLEITRVLRYPKFKLSQADTHELLTDYLPYCEIVDRKGHCPVSCRDPHDQQFLDLAHTGKADVLVTGDEDLLVLSGSTAFRIETPDVYRERFHSSTG